MNRKKKACFKSSTVACLHYNINKGTTKSSVTSPYLFNLFINDLDLVNCPEASLHKYADDSTMQVIVNKDETDCASDVTSQCLS